MGCAKEKWWFHGISWDFMGLKKYVCWTSYWDIPHMLATSHFKLLDFSEYMAQFWKSFTKGREIPCPSHIPWASKSNQLAMSWRCGDISCDIPCGNQTWQWEMDNLSVVLLIKPPFIGCSIAMFDYQRIVGEERTPSLDDFDVPWFVFVTGSCPFVTVKKNAWIMRDLLAM